MWEHREPSQLVQWAMKLATTRPGTWFFLHVAPPFDRALLRLSRGRFNLGGAAPILLLTTTGAKSGRPRSTPLFYLTDGNRLVVLASKGGAPHPPAWYHNLRARPEARVLAGGRELLCRVHEAEGEERERLWKLATRVNPGYETYRERAGRRLPVMVLTPRPEDC